jgi:hypothetical protein
VVVVVVVRIESRQGRCDVVWVWVGEVYEPQRAVVGCVLEGWCTCWCNLNAVVHVAAGVLCCAVWSESMACDTLVGSKLSVSSVFSHFIQKRLSEVCGWVISG